MLSFISNEFISEGILLRIVVIEDNNFKRRGYRANWPENNEENNLYYAIRLTGINESIKGGSV